MCWQRATGRALQVPKRKKYTKLNNFLEISFIKNVSNLNKIVQLIFLLKDHGFRFLFAKFLFKEILFHIAIVF